MLSDIVAGAALALAMQVGPNPAARGIPDVPEELANRPSLTPEPETTVATDSWLEQCFVTLAQDPARAHVQAQLQRDSTSGAERILANHCLGLAATNLGRWDEAVASARRATQAAGDDAAAWALLGEMTRGRAQSAADAASARADFEASARAYAAAVARAPDVAEYQDNLGNTLQVLGRPEAALPHHRRAVELAPDLPATHLNLGNALWMLGRGDAAEAAWRAALAVDPAYEPAWRSLEGLYQRRGDAMRLQQVRDRSLGGAP